MTEEQRPGGPGDWLGDQPGDQPGDWPGDWLRGVLAVCVLRVLADGPTYGYAIAVRLAAAGLGTVKGGTLYPLLVRMERAELVTVEWRAGEGGPGRKYYALTDAGSAELTASAHRWALFAGLTAAFVTAPAVTAPPTPAPRAPAPQAPAPHAPAPAATEETS